MDLALAVGALVDGAGGADAVARAGQGMRAQIVWRTSITEMPGAVTDSSACEDEVGIAVAIGIHTLDVDDGAARRLAVGRRGRALGWF